MHISAQPSVQAAVPPPLYQMHRIVWQLPSPGQTTSSQAQAAALKAAKKAAAEEEAAKKAAAQEAAAVKAAQEAAASKTALSQLIAA